ncbi:MAG: Na/Pi cotransporter family protein [Clostridia bacterium]|nr:Na/Pi cotransporter family protein [Clostridia bacterium]
MDIFGILSLIGGLAIFLYGMNTMSDGLVSLTGGKLERILAKLTKNKYTALLLGTAVTAVIQSSSATTVMVVGFVNSGIMKLEQAVGVIMGANIGTTITSWLLSLTGIQSGNFFIKMLKPSSFSPILAVIGVILLMTNKEGTKKRNLGLILLGFATLIFGMDTMSASVAPLKDNPAFVGMLTTFSKPLFGLIAGTVLTVVIQSSSASVGILQALCLSGAVTYGTALPIIMGQNIGTCITALLSGLGANKNAKRASFIHLYFNLIGTILFMVAFYGINSFYHFDFLADSASAAGIAVIHSIFNVVCTVALFPFSGMLVKLAKLTIGRKSDTAEEILPGALAALDERFLETPSFAVQMCKEAVDEMAGIATKSFTVAMGLLGNYAEDGYKLVDNLEDEADLYEDEIGTYIVKLSQRDLSNEDSKMLSAILHTISDFERISDHAMVVARYARELHEKKLTLTPQSKGELKAFSEAVRDILTLTEKVFVENDITLAKTVEPLEEVIDTLSREMKKRHIKRLKKGECNMESGIILENIITDYERVSDHCSNIAVCLIEVDANEFDTHRYLNNKVKNNDEAFNEKCMKLMQIYTLPN